MRFNDDSSQWLTFSGHPVVCTLIPSIDFFGSRNNYFELLHWRTQGVKGFNHPLKLRHLSEMSVCTRTLLLLIISEIFYRKPLTIVVLTNFKFFFSIEGASSPMPPGSALFCEILGMPMSPLTPCFSPETRGQIYVEPCSDDDDKTSHTRNKRNQMTWAEHFQDHAHVAWRWAEPSRVTGTTQLTSAASVACRFLPFCSV